MIFVVERIFSTFMSFNIIMKFNISFQVFVWFCYYYDRYFNLQSKSAHILKLQQLTNETIDNQLSKDARNYILTYIALQLFNCFKYSNSFDFR